MGHRLMRYDLPRLKTFIAAFLMAMLPGCESLRDIDSPFPPSDALLWAKGPVPTDLFWWTKDPDSNPGLFLALRDCARQNPPTASVSQERNDLFDICMLRKGFKFVPRARGFRNICLARAFRDGIGCQSARGEYVVKPEDRTPDCYETGEWLNRGTCGGFVLDQFKSSSKPSISGNESDNWRDPQTIPNHNSVANRLEIGKALLECGQLTDSQPGMHVDGKRVGMSEGESLATYRCMTQSGFVRVVDLCKDNSHPACRSDAAVPQRSVERRLNSSYCGHFSKRSVCQQL